MAEGATTNPDVLRADEPVLPKENWDALLQNLKADQQASSGPQPVDGKVEIKIGGSATDQGVTQEVKGTSVFAQDSQAGAGVFVPPQESETPSGVTAGGMDLGVQEGEGLGPVTPGAETGARVAATEPVFEAMPPVEVPKPSEVVVGQMEAKADLAAAQVSKEMKPTMADTVGAVLGPQEPVAPEALPARPPEKELEEVMTSPVEGRAVENPTLPEFEEMKAGVQKYITELAKKIEEIDELKAMLLTELGEFKKARESEISTKDTETKARIAELDASRKKGMDEKAKAEEAYQALTGEKPKPPTIDQTPQEQNKVTV